MKSVIVALSLLIGGQVYAAQNCTPYLDTDMPESGRWIYPCGNNTAPQVCQDGEVGYFPDNSYGEHQEVARVCKNGSFFPKAKKVKHRRCAEGTYAYETDLSNDSYSTVTLICKKGRYVRDVRVN